MTAQPFFLNRAFGFPAPVFFSFQTTQGGLVNMEIHHANGMSPFGAILMGILEQRIEQMESAQAADPTNRANLIAELRAYHKAYQTRWPFMSGDLVRVKPIFLNWYKGPTTNRPGLVLEVLDTPIRGDAELESADRGGLLDIRILLPICEKHGNIVPYLMQSALLEICPEEPETAGDEAEAPAEPSETPAAEPVDALPPIPAGVHWHPAHDNFYDVQGNGMGSIFHHQWYARAAEFPTTTGDSI